MSATHSPRAWLALHFTVLLFGCAGLFGHALPVSPWVLVFGRTLFAALSLALCLLALRRPLRPRTGEGGRLALAAGACLALHWVTFFQAIQVGGVAAGLLGFAAFPAAVVALDSLGQRRWPAWRDVAMVGLVSVGLVLVTPLSAEGAAVREGVLWGVLSALLFAVLALLNRRSASGDPLRLAGLQNAAAALWLLPLAVGQLAALSLSDWLGLGVLGVVFTALAHALFLFSLRVLPAQRVAVVTALEPVYGMAFAWLLFAQVPDARMWLGGAVIVLATLWASLGKASKH